jgi:hypothetical protein
VNVAVSLARHVFCGVSARDEQQGRLARATLAASEGVREDVTNGMLVWSAVAVHTLPLTINYNERKFVLSLFMCDSISLSRVENRLQ